MPAWVQTAISWILQNLLWEALMAIIGTSAFRAILWSIGKKISNQRKEYAFWASGFIGGTLILVLINTGFVSPVIKNITQPNFSTDSIQISLSDDYNNLTNHFVRFDFTIFNNGSRGVIRNWNLKIVGPDIGSIFPPGDVMNSPGFTNLLNGGGITVTKTKDSFFQDAGDTPIERGDIAFAVAAES
jgi:hypothetical protein